MRERTTRRRYLRLAGTLSAGVTGAGCLRAGQSSDDGETETPSARLSYPESDRVTWHLPLGGQYNDGLAGVVSTDSGPVAFGGRAGDGWKGPWLLGRDDDGAARWEQTLDAEQLLVPTDGTVLNDGQLAFSLVGLTEAVGGFRGLLVTEADGSVTYRSQPTENGSADRAITQHSDGTLVLGGEVGSNQRNGSVRSVSASGDQQWEYRIGTDGSSVVTGVAPTSDGVIAVGIERQASEQSGWIATVTADGATRQTTLDSPAAAVRRNSDGYLVRTDAGWHRVDEGGGVREHEVFGGHPYPMAAVRSGLLFVGESDDETANGVLVATTDDGQQRWRDTIGGSYRDVLEGVVGLADGSALAVGSTQSYRSEQQAATGTETADDGSPQPNGWLVRIDG